MLKAQMVRERLQVKVVESEKEFEAFREQWNSLLSRSISNTVFLTWEWLYSWWQHFGGKRQLAIRLVYDGEKLVGIAPLYFESTRVRGLIPIKSLQWIGTGTIGNVGSDYLDLIAEPGYEDLVLDSVFDDFRGNAKGWDLLRLTDLPEGCHTLLNFQNRLAKSEAFEYRLGREYLCPYIELKGHTYESYLESLSSNMRYNLRRRTKQMFQKMQGEVVRCESSGDISNFLDAIFDLHLKRWKTRGGSDGFSGSDIRAFHQTAAERLFEKGWLRLYLLLVENCPIAGIYGIEYGGTFSFYQSGFDPAWDRYSIGTVIMGQTVKDAIEQKLDTYDFLHGTEDYKFRWTQKVRKTESLMIYPRRKLAPRLFFLLRTLNQKFQTKESDKHTVLGQPNAALTAEG